MILLHSVKISGNAAGEMPGYGKHLL